MAPSPQPSPTRGEGVTKPRVAVVLAALALVLAAGRAAEAQFGPAPVYLEPAKKEVIRRTVELVGQGQPRRRSTLGVEVSGRVDRMLVQEGQYVKAEAAVCELRRTAVEIQHQGAQAQLRAAKAALAKLEAGYRPEEIEQAEARAKSARAHQVRWELEHKRTQKLLADGASTPSEMEAVEASYRQAVEAVAEAEANLRLAKAGFRREDIEQARAQAAAAESAVNGLADTLDRMTVRMPFNGFVTAKHCEVGEWLSAGRPVVDVLDLDVVRVRLDVPERFLAGLRVGSEARVVFENLSDRAFKGVVTEVVPLSAEATHTATVRVDVANEVADGRPAIAGGVFARVELPLGEPHEALLVPKDAIIRQGGRDLVYTIADSPPPGAKVPEPKPPTTPQEKKMAAMVAENTQLIRETLDKAGAPPPPVKYAVAIPVRLLGGYKDFMEVEAGAVAPGTPLVVRGTYLLSHGAAVQVRPKEAVPAWAREAAPPPGAGAAP